MENSELSMFSKTVVYEKDFIWLKPVCDFFQINYENQTRKIKTDRILANQSTKKSNSFLFGDNYPRVLLTKKGFIRWIQLVNSNTIVEHLREKFTRFQEMIFDYLYGHVEAEKQVRVDYVRLKKLKRLYSNIGREIQRMEENVKLYMDSRFLQLTLPFEEKKRLE